MCVCIYISLLYAVAIATLTLSLCWGEIDAIASIFDASRYAKNILGRTYEYVEAFYRTRSSNSKVSKGTLRSTS